MKARLINKKKPKKDISLKNEAARREKIDQIMQEQALNNFNL